MLADGTPFLVMELLEGESLGDAPARRRARCRSTTAVDFALPDRVGAGRGAREGHRPPRSQARQPVRRRPIRTPSGARADQGARLRHRQAAAGPVRRLGQDAHRHADGHADLHVARAVPRHADGRPPQRHLFAGRHLLRDAGRTAAVRVGGVRRAGQHAPQRAAASARSKRPEIPLALDAHRDEDARQEPGGPLRGHERRSGRAEAGRGRHQIVLVARPGQDAREGGASPATQPSPMHDTTFCARDRRARRDRRWVGRSRGKMRRGRRDRRGGDRGRRVLVAERGRRAGRRRRGGDRRPSRRPPRRRGAGRARAAGQAAGRAGRGQRSKKIELRLASDARAARRSSTTSTARCWA